MRPRAILFDLDGTLLDTLADIATSANEVLHSMNLPVHPMDEFRYFVGDGVTMLMTRVLPVDQHDAKTVSAAIEQFNAIYSKRWCEQTRLYDGIARMLDEVIRRGLRLAVLSNKPHEFTTRYVQKFLGRWPFEQVMGHLPQFPRKPDPTSALEIARRMEVPAADWIYLGDSSIDMKTATAAGMLPVGALWGFRTREELESSGAKAVIERPGDLMSIVQSLRI